MDRLLFCKWLPKITCLFLLIALSACQPETTQENTEPVARPVKYYVIGERGGGQEQNYPGRVVASQEVDLAFQVSGQVIEKPVLKGQQVKKGELLIKLDPRDFEIKLNEANATLNQTQADFERAKELLETRTISQSQFEDMKAKYEIAVAQRDAAEKALKDSVIYAPFSGIVADTFVDNFQNIKAKDRILSLQDISEVDIEVNVPEQDLLFARRKEEAAKLATKYIVLDTLPDRKFDVSLKSFRAEADPITNTFLVTLTMPSPKDLNILPGMSVTFFLRWADAKAADLVSVPVQAVLTDNSGERYVWLIDEELKVRKQTVQTGEFANDSVAITQGLNPGDKVVTAGMRELSEGKLVRLWEHRDTE